MKRLLFYSYKVLSKLLGSNEIMNNYYRRGGAKIGTGCLICTNISGVDSWLIEIGNNTTISTEVSFILHDFSASLVFPGKSNIYGKIVVGNNCFVGARTVLMYGVELADNIIVASGSVVTKSFKENNIIIGGNPAKKIGDWTTYKDKYEAYATFASKIKAQVMNGENVLVKR